MAPGCLPPDPPEARRTRKVDTRRKVLIGAIVIMRIEQGQGRFPEAGLRAWLEEGLTRDDDRALFERPARTRSGEPPKWVRVSPSPPEVQVPPVTRPGLR